MNKNLIKYFSRLRHIAVVLTIAIFFYANCTGKAKMDVKFAEKDLIAPQVLSILPSDGQTEVNDKPTITIVFNEPMDAASLNSSTVIIKSKSGSLVGGFFVYDESLNALSFSASQNLFTNTQYIVEVSNKVKDKAGNAFAGMSSTFSTDVCPKSGASKTSLNGAVNAIVKIGCTLYIGGDFTSAGMANAMGTKVNLITGKNVTSYNYQTINSNVYAAVSDGEGGLYIGGGFTKIGTYARNRVAHLSASGEVLPWNPEVSYQVNSLALADGIIYVGGSFATVNGITRNNLAAIDLQGNVTSFNPNVNGAIEQIVVDNSIVYYSGSFTSVGGVNRGSLAATTTSGILTSWSPNANNSVKTMILTGSTFFIGGDFTCLGNCTSGTENVDKWTRGRLASLDLSGNILSWSPNANATVFELQVKNSNIYAVGSFTSIGGTARGYLAAIDKSSGLATTWAPTITGTNVLALAIKGSNVYISGNFTQVKGNKRRNAAALDLTGNLLSWQPEPSGAGRVLLPSTTDIFIGGYYPSIQTVERKYLVSVDTTGLLQTWQPMADQRILKLATDGTNIFAVGIFSCLGNCPSGTENVDKWTRNSLAKIGQDGSIKSWNPKINTSNVKAIVTSGTTSYIGGFFSCLGNCPAGTENVDKWTRNNLAAVDSAGNVTNWNPNVNSQIMSLAMQGSLIYIGGSFATVGGTSRSNLALVDTNGNLQAWNPGANAAITNLHLADSTLYVAGYFTSIGGSSRSKIAAIDINGTLHPWAPSIGTNYINSISVGKNVIYLGGSFASINGSSQARYLGAVDSQANLVNWYPKPSIIRINKILYSNSTLYIGGQFTSIGGQQAYNISSINADGSMNW